MAVGSAEEDAPFHLHGSGRKHLERDGVGVVDEEVMDGGTEGVVDEEVMDGETEGVVDETSFAAAVSYNRVGGNFGIAVHVTVKFFFV